MKKLRIKICLAALLSIAASTQAEEVFGVWGYDHLDVTTSYYQGHLYEYSTANILPGADVFWLYAYDSSTLNISGGKGVICQAYESSAVNVSDGSLSSIVASNNSTANVSGGSVDENIEAYHNSIINISGGSTPVIDAYSNSTVNISGGNISKNIYTADNSIVNISGGSVSSIRALDLRFNGPQRVTITAGTVETLSPGVVLEASNHFDYIADFSISDLVSFGLQAESGTIGTIGAASFTAYDNSSLSISGGSVDWISAEDSSIVNISGGNINKGISAEGNGIVNISGGNISGEVAAEDTSTIIFQGYDFTLGQGLSWDIDGQTILGHGILTGILFDNTSFEVICWQESESTIMAIPEPATFVLLSLASLFLRKKNRR